MGPAGNTIQVVLQILPDNSNSGSDPPPFIGDYYVAVNGTGTGFAPSDPMSPSDFLLIVLADGNNVFFLDGDVFTP